jgi:methionyl-tRNA formyltransferase
LRVAFAGTPPFAARILEAILAAGHSVPLVLTQPDRPAGRGLKLTPSAVSDVARSMGLVVEKPASLKSEESRRSLAESRPDVLVVAAYGLILPESVLALPLQGCLNVHASLLPRWRGAAPVQRAILAGDAETGVDIMRMEAGLDTGPVLLERRVAIGAEDTAGTLAERLAVEGSQAIVQALANLQTIDEKTQSEIGVTYAAKIDKAEAMIDWSAPADAISRRIRAFNPAPGAVTLLAGKPLKIWEAVVVGSARGPAGTVVGHHSGAPLVACGTAGLALTLVQPAGSKRMPGTDFLMGHSIAPGTVLG